MSVTQAFGYIGLILQAVSVIMGLGLFLIGILRLKKYGEMRTFASHQMSIWGPLMCMISGIMLLCLPVALKTAALGFWGHTNPMKYGDTENHFLLGIILFVRIVGVLSFMRGVVLLSRTGQEHAQPGALSKAMVHMFSGLLCLYLKETAGLLGMLFGLIIV
jgi:intracellular multiplication protein IcmC